MKVAFVSNYINHHQIPFCNAMIKRLGNDFTFVQTEPMEKERVQMGWNPMAQEQNFVKCSYESPEECSQLILDSDVVIWGGVEDETMLWPRLLQGKVVFRYSERLYKTGQWKAISPRGLIKKYKDHTSFRKAPVYLLCAGAYVPSDFHIVRSYPHKMLKWGYFPETKQYDVEKLMKNKKSKNTKVEILWAARFLDWKHPEAVVALVQKLRESHDNFHVTMIGGGEMETSIKSMIREKGLEELITLAGFLTPEQVRVAMEGADIFLQTSDRYEGWGAVLNEAMNSGCAVVSSHMIGAARYLIEQGKNGCMYHDGDLEELYMYVSELLGHNELREDFGKKAYKTINEVWNAETAADRLFTVLEDVLCGRGLLDRWENGPCSKARVIKEREQI